MRIHRWLPFGLVMTALIVSLLVSQKLRADEVYKWVDDEGKTHYSTRAQKGLKPAKLPKIERENLDRKIAKIKAETPANCGPHGGVDCEQGADSDGSVVCVDGFRGAKLPFRFRCLEVKLSVNEVAYLDKDKNVVAADEKDTKKAPQNVLLTLRNDSNVEAFGVNVHFVALGVTPVPATGPKKIDPFSVAEYTAPLKQLAATSKTPKLSAIDYRVDCTNCRSVRTAAN